MDLSICTMIFLIFSMSLWSTPSGLDVQEPRPIYTRIVVGNGAKRGFWAWEPTICPSGYARGFAIKLDRVHGKLMWQDDSSLNGIRLFCSDGTDIENRVGPQGRWLIRQMCPGQSYLTSFALRVARPQPLWIFGDDAGVTNIKFKCSDDTELVGTGQSWGKYGHWSPSCSPAYICGIRTRIDSVRAWIDTSGLNDVMFYCCF